MKKTTTALLILCVGSTLTLNASAKILTSLTDSELNAKCRISYTKGEIDSNLSKPIKQVVKFTEFGGTKTHSNRCKRGTNILIKKANEWLKKSFENADGVLQRTITNIQPIECAVEHKKGFAWIRKGYGVYKECEVKYGNKFKNKLIKKL
jgi:pyruvate kinase